MKSLFDDADFRAELQQNAAQARERVARLEQIAEISVGDSFVFAETYELPVRWVCILPHVDDSSLWFLVAADEFPRIGTCDIELPDSHPWAPLAIRCNVGFWAHSDDLDRKNYIGRLDGDSIADAKDRLAEMVLGQVPITQHGLISEAHHEYREWIEELSEAVERIESRLHSDPIVLSDNSFNRAWASDRIVAMRHQQVASLAADGTGLQRPVHMPLAMQLPSKLQGRLLLQRDAEMLDLVYYPTLENELPPELFFASTVDIQKGEWKIGADGVWTWSQSLGMQDGVIVLTLGAECFRIQLS